MDTLRIGYWQSWGIAGLILVSVGLLPSISCIEPTAGVSVMDLEKTPFAPPPLPSDFDETKAKSSLNAIPDDPETPAERVSELPELPRQALRQIDEARRLMLDQKYADAASLLKSALHYHSGHWQNQRLLATVALWSGNGKVARQAAEQTLTLKPADIAAHYILAALAMENADATEAFRRYRLILKCPVGSEDWPFVALTRYRLALLLEERGYVAAAIEQLKAFETLQTKAEIQTAVANNPEWVGIVKAPPSDCAFRLARLHGLLGQYAQAADALKQAVQATPTDGALRAEYVRMLMRAGNTKQAAIEVEQLAAASDDDPEMLRLLLSVHIYAGHPERGAAAMRRMVAARPESIELHLVLADALAAAGRVNEAVGELNEYLHVRGESQAIRWKLVELYRRQPNWSSWLTALAEAVASRQETYSRAVTELRSVPTEIARQLVDQGVQELVARGCKSEWTLSHDNARAALDYLLARLADQQNRTEDVRLLLEHSGRLWPKFSPAVVGMVELYVQRCRWQEALDALEQLKSELDQPPAAVIRLTAQCQDGLDDFERAAESYRQAIEHDSHDLNAMMLLGRLYERQGDSAKAREQFQAAIEVDPDYLPAREALIRVLWGRREQANTVMNELNEMRKRGVNDAATLRVSLLIRFLAPPSPDVVNYTRGLRKLVEMFPRDTRTLEELGAVLLGMREYAEAEKIADVLLKIDPYSAIGHELKAMAMQRLLRIDEAMRQLDYMLTLYPHREGWIRNLADLLTLDVQYDRAAQYWQRLLAADSAKERTSLYRAKLMQTLRRARRFDEAYEIAGQWLAEAERIAATQPADVAVDGGGDKTDADETDEGTTSPPDEKTLAVLRQKHEMSQLRWYVLAAIAGTKDNERYLRQVQQWLDKEPKSAELQAWLLGVEVQYPVGSPGPMPERAGLTGANRQNEALLKTAIWMQTEPAEKRFVHWTIDILQSAGQLDQAIELGRSLIAVSEKPGERLVHEDTLRVLLLRARRYDDAVNTVKDLMAEDRRLMTQVDEARQGWLEMYLFEHRRLLANVLMLARRFNESIEQFETLINEQIEWRTRAENIIGRLRDPRQRMQLGQEMQRIQQRQALLLRSLSNVYQKQGQFEIAEQRMREALELLPREPGVSNDLGYLLADQCFPTAVLAEGENVLTSQPACRLDEAERLIRIAAAEDLSQPAYLDSLAWLLYKRGEFEAAERWLTRASNLDNGRDPTIMQHLGDVQWRLGKKDAAVASWRESLELVEQHVAEGQTHVDDEQIGQIRTRLEQVRVGDKVSIALAAPDTRPAN